MSSVVQNKGLPHAAYNYTNFLICHQCTHKKPQFVFHVGQVPGHNDPEETR